MGRGREPSGGSHRAVEIGPRAVWSAVGRWQAQAVRISLQPGVEMAAAWISLQSGVELQERERMRIETLAHRMSQLVILAEAYATRVGIRVPDREHSGEVGSPGERGRGRRRRWRRWRCAYHWRALGCRGDGGTAVSGCRGGGGRMLAHHGVLSRLFLFQQSSTPQLSCGLSPLTSPNPRRRPTRRRMGPRRPPVRYCAVLTAHKLFCNLKGPSKSRLSSPAQEYITCR